MHVASTCVAHELIRFFEQDHNQMFEKGKPLERVGRKATGPPEADSRVAEQMQRLFEAVFCAAKEVLEVLQCHHNFT